MPSADITGCMKKLALEQLGVPAAERQRIAGSKGEMQEFGCFHAVIVLRFHDVLAVAFTILTNTLKNAIVDSGCGRNNLPAVRFPIPLRGTHRYHPPAKFSASDLPKRDLHLRARPVRSLC